MKFLKFLLVGALAYSVLSANESGKITFAGSSTLAPVISKAGTDFAEKFGSWDKVKAGLPAEKIEIFISPGGSGAGVKAVIDGTSDFGMLARDVKADERAKIENMQEFTLGIDALNIAVNPQNDLIKLKKGNLSKAEIVKIFSGEYKKWSDLDPALPSDEIVIVTRDLGGGAHEIFQNKIMKDVKVSKDAIQAPSMGALVAKIIQNPRAIGYASFGIANQNAGKITSLKIEGVEPSRENILNKSYEISRPLIIIKKGEPSKTQSAFVEYLRSEAGVKTIEEQGFIVPSK